MKLLKLISDFFAPSKTDLEEYITLRRPQNTSDLERIVREWHEYNCGK
jgi:hypothetical protein